MRVDGFGRVAIGQPVAKRILAVDCVRPRHADGQIGPHRQSIRGVSLPRRKEIRWRDNFQIDARRANGTSRTRRRSRPCRPCVDGEHDRETKGCGGFEDTPPRLRPRRTTPAERTDAHTQTADTAHRQFARCHDGRFRPRVAPEVRRVAHRLGRGRAFHNGRRHGIRTHVRLIDRPCGFVRQPRERRVRRNVDQYDALQHLRRPIRFNERLEFRIDGLRIIDVRLPRARDILRARQTRAQTRPRADADAANLGKKEAVTIRLHRRFSVCQRARTRPSTGVEGNRNP